jgi:hypothetical protein
VTVLKFYMAKAMLLESKFWKLSVMGLLGRKSESIHEKSHGGE